MKIGIMCSIDFAKEVEAIKKDLEANGHIVSVSYTIEKILKGEMQLEDLVRMKSEGTFAAYAQSGDLIRWNWERMIKDEAILVININKKGIANYIGGNTFLEMGFAHVLQMKIFLWKDIPDMIYKDEMVAMNPTVIHENIDNLQP